MARERLAEARSLALTFQDSLRQIALMDVAISYGNNGDNTTVSEIADAIGESTVEGRAVYNYLARAQARAGNIGGALTSFHVIARTSYLRAEAAHAITEALSKSGEPESALAWANSLLSPYERAQALLGIVQGQFTENN